MFQSHNAANATVLFSTPHSKIPAEGTLKRCPHGIYWPEGDRLAWYCGACNPLNLVPDGGTHDVHFPARHRLCGTPMDMRANPYDTGNYCPKCGGLVHVVEDDGRWRCADCGKVWRAKVKKTGKPEEEAVAV